MASNRDHSAARASLVVIALLAAACGSTPGAASNGGGTTAQPQNGHASTPVTVVGSPAPALPLLWESAGDAVPSGSDPATYWPAVDPTTGNIWVALSFDDRYWIFSPQGKYLATFGGPGSGQGQFNFKRPCDDCGAGAIAFTPDGSFFVADDGNNRIQKFDAAHHFVRAWGTFGSGDGQFADANVIATDGSSVYVYDGERGDIQVFDTDGHFLRKVSTLNGWLALDKAGNLYASENTAGTSAIAEYDASGTLRRSFDLPPFDGDRIGLAVDALGRLYFNIQDVNRPYAALGLVRFDPAANTFTRWATGGESLAIDPSQQAIYEANFVSPGWPKPALRKYALPTP